MNKKDVIIIASEFPPGPGGIGKHAFDLARALAFKNYRVTVFANQDFSTEEEIRRFTNSLPPGIELRRFHRQGWRTYIIRWNVVKNYIADNPPELIIASGRFPLWMSWIISKTSRTKFNLHAFVHGSELGTRWGMYQTFTKLALQNADYVWAVSQFTKNLILKILPKGDIRILPNGLWIDEWNLENSDLQQKNHSLMRNPSLLTVGRISPRKGQHRVVKAIPLLSREFPGMHYHIVGISTENHELVKIASELHVTDQITIHGKINSQRKLSDFYNGADVFIMLSENQPNGDVEGFGIAILEANFFGIPAIGAKGNGINDAICDNYNGILVNGDNATEIAEALKTILNEYHLFSANAKLWAQKHDWKILIENFLNPESGKQTHKLCS